MGNIYPASERLMESVYLFLFFSIIGWVYEVSLAFLYGYGFINRGFLLGPYLPLYGFGALLLIVSLSSIMQKSVKIGRISVTPVIIFVLIILITTSVEYVVGWCLEMIFHQRWWDYSTYKYQLHGRISLSASIRFGLGGMVFLYLLAPLFQRLIRMIPKQVRKGLSYGICVLLLLDFILTLVLASRNGFDPTLGQPR